MERSVQCQFQDSVLDMTVHAGVLVNDGRPRGGRGGHLGRFCYFSGSVTIAAVTLVIPTSLSPLADQSVSLWHMYEGHGKDEFLTEPEKPFIPDKETNDAYLKRMQKLTSGDEVCRTSSARGPLPEVDWRCLQSVLAAGSAVPRLPVHLPSLHG